MLGLLGPDVALARRGHLLILQTHPLCGDGQIQLPEQCDDGNVTNGDGCSSTCTVQQQYTDLASGQSGRGFIGTVAGAQLQDVVIGNFDGSGGADIVVSQLLGVTVTGTLARSSAGTIYGFSGGGSFFTNTSASVVSGYTFAAVGQDANDNMGVSAGRNLIADVTGDGTADVIVSAALADGVGNARADCGEIYVFQGGAGLTGYLNLRPTLPAQVVADIIGPSAGASIRLLAARDVNGDGRADLLIGAPLTSPNGRANSGTVYLLSGAAATGTVDLSVAGVIATFQGATAGDQLGESGTLGDITNDGTVDVILASARFGSTNGAVWTYTGAVAGTIDVNAGTWSSRFLGSGTTVQLGNQVEVANVRGTTANDLIITGALFDNQCGMAFIWDGPVANGDRTVLYNSHTANTAITGVDPGDLFGGRMAVGFMGSGSYADMAIGARQAAGPLNARSNSGSLYVVRGNQTLPATRELFAIPASVQVDGPVANDLMTRTISGVAVGDLDNDGRADYCAGGVQANSTAGHVDCFRSIFP